MRLRLVDAAAPRGSVPMEMDPRSSGFTASGQDLRMGGYPDLPSTRIRHLSSSNSNDNHDAAGAVVSLNFCYFLKHFGILLQSVRSIPKLKMTASASSNYTGYVTFYNVIFKYLYRY